MNNLSLLFQGVNDIKDALDISLKLGNDRITGLLLGALCQKRASKDLVLMISDYIHNTLIWFRLDSYYTFHQCIQSNNKHIFSSAICE